MTNSKWKCPFCDHLSIITDNGDYGMYSAVDLYRNGSPHLVDDQKYALKTIICPNNECRKTTVWVEQRLRPNEGNYSFPVSPNHTWRLSPRHSAKIFPAYIPEVLRTDYTEACMIANDSPKASATLARRCLQGMIRDFWGVARATLNEEINTIRAQIPQDTYESIDALRQIGNIGAHMEKDINVIVDVEPEEANLLIQLIENLFEDWYVARHNRAQRAAKLQDVAAAKKAQKSTSPAK